jgi:hypothetical protein
MSPLTKLFIAWPPPGCLDALQPQCAGTRGDDEGNGPLKGIDPVTEKASPWVVLLVRPSYNATNACLHVSEKKQNLNVLLDHISQLFDDFWRHTTTLR